MREPVRRAVVIETVSVCDDFELVSTRPQDKSPSRKRHAHCQQEPASKLRRLMSACRFGHATEIKQMKFEKSQLNSFDENGWVPLAIAAACGHVNVVKELVELGADTTINCNGLTTEQITALKFFETGRVCYLQIADILSGNQPKHIDFYQRFSLYQEHPMNQVMSSVKASIEHLTSRICCEAGCSNPVIVPYDYCGGRYFCARKLEGAGRKLKEILPQNTVLPTPTSPVLTSPVAPSSPTTTTSTTNFFGSDNNSNANSDFEVSASCDPPIPLASVVCGVHGAVGHRTHKRAGSTIRGGALLPLTNTIILGTPPRHGKRHPMVVDGIAANP
eukprot:c5176_g1_i1.p1 GENE.c5176_g1_i1~~c5176_g1_i1.p1  ORF type:complete len:358 (-),score=51.98 c5176_g1_i1:9-1004(-)